jgi:hypothetical protein
VDQQTGRSPVLMQNAPISQRKSSGERPVPLSSSPSVHPVTNELTSPSIPSDLFTGPPSIIGVISVTVGTAIASCPPYRSVRAELPHTAPTLDGWRRSALQGKDAGHEDEVSIVRRLDGCVSSSGGCTGCDVQAWRATECRAGRGSSPT